MNEKLKGLAEKRMLNIWQIESVIFVAKWKRVIFLDSWLWKVIFEFEYSKISLGIGSFFYIMKID